MSSQDVVLVVVAGPCPAARVVRLAGEATSRSLSVMSVTVPWYPTPRARRSLPRTAPLAVTSSLLLLGAGLLVGSTWRAASQVREMRARGREVKPLVHDIRIPGADPVRRLAVIGDSAAAGHGLPDADLAFARLVARELTRQDGRTTTVINVAVDGATTSDVLDQQLEAVCDAEVVVVSVGVNDSIRRHRLSRIERDLRALISGIRERAAPDAVTVLLSTPDLAVAPGLPTILCPPLGVMCRATARVQRRVAQEFGIPILELPRATLTPDVFGDDGFHPGAVGHARLAEGILDRLAQPAPAAR
jgi:lysophospholipase L1-like esterase